MHKVKKEKGIDCNKIHKLVRFYNCVVFHIITVSSVKALASLISSLVSTQKSLCGEGLESGPGKGSTARRINSLPVASGNDAG